MIKEKSDVMNKVITFFKGRELFYNDFESRIFLLLNRSIALTKPEKSNLSEHPISPQNLSSWEYSSNYGEYISPKTEIEEIRNQEEESN